MSYIYGYVGGSGVISDGMTGGAEKSDFHKYCDGLDIDGFPLSDFSVRPLPCLRDEHGEIAAQTVKRLFAKINEELDELKECIFIYSSRSTMYDGELDDIAEEAADTITAITTMLEALGIDAEMRDEAQRRVNDKNRKRGRL